MIVGFFQPCLLKRFKNIWLGQWTAVENFWSLETCSYYNTYWWDFWSCLWLMTDDIESLTTLFFNLTILKLSLSFPPHILFKKYQIRFYNIQMFKSVGFHFIKTWLGFLTSKQHEEKCFSSVQKKSSHTLLRSPGSENFWLAFVASV